MCSSVGADVCLARRAVEKAMSGLEQSAMYLKSPNRDWKNSILFLVGWDWLVWVRISIF